MTAFYMTVVPAVPAVEIFQLPEPQPTAASALGHNASPVLVGESVVLYLSGWFCHSFPSLYLKVSMFSASTVSLESLFHA